MASVVLNIETDASHRESGRSGQRDGRCQPGGRKHKRRPRSRQPDEQECRFPPESRAAFAVGAFPLKVECDLASNLRVKRVATDPGFSSQSVHHAQPFSSIAVFHGSPVVNRSSCVRHLTMIARASCPPAGLVQSSGTRSMPHRTGSPEIWQSFTLSIPLEFNGRLLLIELDHHKGSPRTNAGTYAARIPCCAPRALPSGRTLSQRNTRTE